jgi:ADP-ribose pyrophosphatase
LDRSTPLNIISRPAAAAPRQPNMDIRPWKKVSSQPIGNFRIFSLRSDRVISPRTQHEHEVYVLDCPNWVNVIALTPDQRLVMIEQYRHGSTTVELEIPGGMVDAGDASPAATGARELREETGYEGEGAQIIGQVFPNPAIMSNTCFTVMLENCRCLHPVQFDHGEDLVTRLVPVAEVPQLVAAGKIRHSLVVAALYFFDLWQRGEGASRASSG